MKIAFSNKCAALRKAAKNKTKLMSASSQKMLPVRAIFAGWLFMIFLMRPMAADQALVSASSGALDQESIVFQVAAPAEAEAAKTESGSFQSLAASFPEPNRGEASPQNRSELKKLTESRKPGFVSDVRPSFATLLIFYCLL